MTLRRTQLKLDEKKLTLNVFLTREQIQRKLQKKHAYAVVMQMYGLVF